MDTSADILELKFDGNGINPSAVKPHEIAELIINFEKALLSVIKQQHSEIDTDILLFSFEAIRDESLDLRFVPRKVSEIVLSSYLLLATCVKTGDFNGLSNTTISSLRSFTRFSKKYDCNGYFTYNNETISSFNPNTEISINKNKVIKEETSIYGKLIDVGGENPNVHIRINDESVLIFKTSEANVKLLAPKIYEKVKLVGEAKWDAETFEIIDFKLSSISDYVPGKSFKAINELKSITSGHWDKYNSNDEINDQLLRD